MACGHHASIHMNRLGSLPEPTPTSLGGRRMGWPKKTSDSATYSASTASHRGTRIRRQEATVVCTSPTAYEGAKTPVAGAILRRSGRGEGHREVGDSHGEGGGVALAQVRGAASQQDELDGVARGGVIAVS